MRTDGVCPLYVRCTLNGQRFEVATGFMVHPDNWNESKQLIKGRTEDVKIINNRLEKIRTKIQDIYNQLESFGEPFDVLSIKDKFLGNHKENGLIEIFEAVIKDVGAKVGKDYAPGTLKHYQTSKKRLQEFLRTYTNRSDIALSKVDFGFISSFDLFLKKDKKVMPNTALTYHKHLKKVYNSAISLGYVLHNPYESFKPTRNKTNRDFLSMSELEKIRDKRIVIPRMDLVRDVFVFASYTGLSYSDLMKLSTCHIQKGSDGKDWVIIDRSKTESRCTIPLLPAAIDVLKKYEDHPDVLSNNRLLPIYSNQKMNAYLKELADICGIQKNLSMHVARHTFATSVTLTNGVPLETVSKMLGHTSLKTTQIYARIVDSKISNDMELLNRKLNAAKIEVAV
ncbi:MAG: site-specific integrase [Prolixibacteraceae bacterium]|nr:site-specific integrase [Prolixibacteraceae bacterium]